MLGFILTVSKMVTIRQEGPPPGGYGPIDWSKKVGKRLNGIFFFAPCIVVARQLHSLTPFRNKISSFYRAKMSPFYDLDKFVGSSLTPCLFPKQ